MVPIRPGVHQSVLRRQFHNVETSRQLVDSTQHRIAERRGAVVTALGRVSAFPHATPGSAERSEANQAGERRISDVLARVDRIHRRLLQLSAAVERESDRVGSPGTELEFAL